MKWKALGCNCFWSGLCGFLGAEFCGNVMSMYFRTERKAREDAILSMRDDVEGNLTATNTE